MVKAWVPKIWVAGLLLAALLPLGISHERPAVDRQFPPQGEALLAEFRSGNPLNEHAYENLFLYFVQGFQTYRSPEGASAAFPGWMSRNGKAIDAMEGFSRMAPLWGAWVSSGRPSRVRLPGGEWVDVGHLFRRGLLAGTNPSGPEYWGNIGNYDQRLCEASDIALSVWLFRNSVWKELSAAEQRQVLRWLQQVNGKQIADNNWHLFVTFVNEVLHSLGGTYDTQGSLAHYQRVKQFYRGDGWFSDGPKPKFDFYNAWGIHYQLFWLQQVNPAWDHEFLESVRRQFASVYRFILTPQGVPLLGRSICYRIAVATPLILAQDMNSAVDPGQARHALDVTWRYFIEHDGVQNGNVTQGYCGPDERLIDNYSGPASCLWSLRSLIAALYQPASSSFWTAPTRKLPIEVEDFNVVVPATGWTIRGKRANATVELDTRGAAATNNDDTDLALDDVSVLDRVKTLLTGKPHRPANYKAKYSRKTYLSNPPYCGCPN